MSTFLVTLGVVTASIATVMTLTVRDPEQPATLRRSRRGGPRWDPRVGLRELRRLGNLRHVRRPPKPPEHRPVPVRPVRPAAARPAHRPTLVETPERASSGAVGAASVAGVAVATAPSFTDRWVAAPVGLPLWARVRSGVFLMVMLAVVGTIIAATVSGVLVLIAIAVRHAVA